MPPTIEELKQNAVHSLQQAKYKEAIGIYKEAINLAGSKDVVWELKTKLGETYIKVQQYHETIELALTALDTLTNTAGSMFHISGLYRLLSNTYVVLELDDKALKFALLALQSADQCDQDDTEVQKLKGTVHSNLCTIYASMERLDEAAPHQHKAIDIKKQLRNEPSLAYSYQNFAFFWFQKGEYDKAANYCNKAIEIRERLDLKPKLIFSLAVMGRILNAKKEYKEALKYLLKAKQLAKSIGEKNVLFREVYNYLPHTYAGLGKFKKAYKYSETFRNWLLKTFQQKDAEHTAKLQVQHETSQKEREVLENKLKALKAQMNPHFLFNGLASIQNFILDDNPNDALRYLADFSKLLRKTLDQSGSTSISLEEEIEFLESYLRIESLRFQNRFDHHFEIAKEIDADDVLIPPMILQPYVENAIKHGLMHKEGKGTIYISFAQKDETTLRATVEDNGIGRKAAQEMKAKTIGHKSKGLSITASRLDLLNQSSGKSVNVAVVDLEDENGNPAGTRVEILLPVS